VNTLARERIVYGFDLRTGFLLVPHQFRYRGRRYKLRRRDIAYIKTLAKIVDQARGTRPTLPGWLLSYRGQFLQMREDFSHAVLSNLVLRARDTDMRRLAIWLLGHCPGTLGVKALAIAAGDDSLAVRREAARALKRKGGWAELRDLQARDPDERIQAFARPTSPKPLPERLNQYLDDVTPHTVAQAPQTLKLNVNLRDRPGLPPKSSLMIRYVLERIHRLVHGYSKF
jgi:hypothetical protein